jgi:hypothetical protein
MGCKIQNIFGYDIVLSLCNDMILSLKLAGDCSFPPAHAAEIPPHNSWIHAFLPSNLL